MAARRSFGAISKLPSGRYRARYTGPDAAWHGPGRTFAAKIDAEGWLAAERRLIDLGTWTPPSVRNREADAAKVAVADWCETSIARRGLRPGSADTYRSLVKTRIAPYIGDVPLGEVSAQTIERWLSALAVEHPGTASRNAQAYVFLSTAFRSAVDEGLVAASPCVSPKAGRKPRPKRKPLLTGGEYVALVNNLPERYQLLAHVMAGCALRLGEATALRVQDVRFVRVADEPAAAKIHVDRTLSWTSQGPVYGPPKSDTGTRYVTVPPHLVPPLEKLVKARGGRGELLFVNQNGAAIRHQGFRDTFWRAANKAGRPDVSPHQLRHFGAVQAALAGATLRELMDRLGHATSSMAVHYQHTAADRDTEIARRISELNQGNQ